jgi:hypothetical protein
MIGLQYLFVVHNRLSKIFPMVTRKMFIRSIILKRLLSSLLKIQAAIQSLSPLLHTFAWLKVATFMTLITMFYLLSEHSLQLNGQSPAELKRYLSNCKDSNTVPKVIWVFDFEEPAATHESLERERQRSSIPIVYLNSETVQEFLDWPVHPAVQYLSPAHKSDYFRIYFTYHFGGGYSDIGLIAEDWKPYFRSFTDLNIWIVGAPIKVFTSPPGITFPKELFSKMISNGLFIARNRNRILQTVHTFQNQILDQKLDQLKNETNTNYPIRKDQLLGEIMTFRIIQYNHHVSRGMKNIKFTENH